MGNFNSDLKYINYEDVQNFQKLSNCLIINTMDEKNQKCLIFKTCKISDEEKAINNLLNSNKNINIIIYGKNNLDKSIFKKEKQLSDLGFVNIFIYLGGLFEWLCLQDIYGNDLFKTTTRELDILKYKSDSYFNQLSIM